MQDENIFKMSEVANPEIKDVPTLNILLCYLLYKIDKPVETEHLYEIAVSTGLINYFYYQDSIDYLQKNDCIKIDVIPNELPIINISRNTKDIYDKYELRKRRKKIIVIDLYYDYLSYMYELGFRYPKFDFIYVGALCCEQILCLLQNSAIINFIFQF